MLFFTIYFIIGLDAHGAKLRRTFMNICILDDNTATTNGVGQMAAWSCQRLNIPDPAIFRFTSSEKFLTWLDQNDSLLIDVCFLDIDLKSETNGLAIARLIKDKNYHTLLVFMTVYDHYFTEMVQVEPFRFLAKPFQYEEFHKVFLEVHKRINLENSENKCMYSFKKNGITFSVNLNDIISISSDKRKIILLHDNGDRPSFYGKLDQVEQDVKLLTDKFMRISKSFLVNTDFVESIGKNSLSIQGSTYNISPKYKAQKEKIT